jgi:hypothetical protein
MLQKLIRSKADFTLNTAVEEYMLSIDEVRWIKFKNEEQVQELIRLGNIEEASPSTPLQKPIPVLYPKPHSISELGVIRRSPSLRPHLPKTDLDLPMESDVDALLKRMREKVGQK